MEGSAVSVHNLNDELEALKGLLGDDCIVIEIKGKLKILVIKFSPKIHLKVTFQDGYPNVAPSSIKILHNKNVRLTTNEELLVEELIRNTNAQLNDIIDANRNKFCILEIHNKLTYILESNSHLLEIFDPIEDVASQSKIETEPKKSVKNKKIKNATKTDDSDDNNSCEKHKFKGADIIFQRLKWDPNVKTNQVVIGYLDRFKGVMEIKFSEFKGVHDDRDGIPLHRIRHYKINDKIVWERDGKVDLLTGHDLSEYFKDELIASSIASKIDKPLNKEPTSHVSDRVVFKFDSSVNMWVNCETSQIATDKHPFIDTLKIVTYNILSDTNFKNSLSLALKSNAIGVQNFNQMNRVNAIIQQLTDSNADLVSLQECSQNEESQLRNCKFIRDNYFICSTNTFSTNLDCVILSRFKPKLFKVLNLIENSAKVALIVQFEARISQLIKAENILFTNLHLTSDMSTNSTDKRKRQLESLVNYLKSIEHIGYKFVCGDFNISDSQADVNAIKVNLIENGFIDLAPNGNTFDPKTNFTAAITSTSRSIRRLDRVYMNGQLNSYTVESRNLIGTAPLKFQTKETIYYEPYSTIAKYFNTHSVDLNAIELNDDDFYESSQTLNQMYNLHASDHYGLEVCVKFKNSLSANVATHQAALAIIAPKSASMLVQGIREKYDRTFDRWPPHINLLYPFYESVDIENTASEVFNVLADLEPFDVNLTNLSYFSNNSVVYLKPSESETRQIVTVQTKLRDLFDDLDRKNRIRKDFVPHMTIAQPDRHKENKKNWSKQTYEHLSMSESNISLSFTVDCVYWITRNGDEPFKTKFTFPLGSCYPSIRLGLRLSDQTQNGLLGYLNDKNMLNTTEKQTDLMNSVNCVVANINRNLDNLKRNSNGSGVHYTETALVGSFLYGIQSNDIDLAILKVQPDLNSVSNTYTSCMYENSFDEFAASLSRQLALDSNYHTTRNINDAIAPIIEITLNESEENQGLLVNGINMIDIQLHEIPYELFDLYSKHAHNDYNAYMRALAKIQPSNSKLFVFSGLFEIFNLKKYTTHFKDFQVLLSFVKHWAKSRGIYGKAYGFLGGISYSILVVYFLQKCSTVQNFHLLEVDNCDGRFFELLIKFFEFYSGFNWPDCVVSLVDVDKVEQETKSLENVHKTPITILQSVFPYHNTSRNVSKFYAKIISNEFKNANEIIIKREFSDSNDHRSVYHLCKRLCEENEIDLKGKSHLRFQLFCLNRNDAHHVLSLMKSKTQGLVTNIEKLLNDEVRVYPDFVYNHTTGTKYPNFYENYMVLNIKGSLTSPQRQQILGFCDNFCTSVYAMCHTSELEIKYIDKLDF